jgi:hypothetical protein
VSHFDHPPAWALDILSRIDSIGKRLDKLDIIEASVNTMKRDIKAVDNRVSEIENSQEFLSSTWESTKTYNEAAKHELDAIRKVLDTTLSENANISEEIVDRQCRSMRDNLMFYNLAESESENCIHLIETFCKEKLKFEEVIEIDRSHRIGKQVPGKIRPIVTKFRNFQQRETIRKSARLLKGSDYYIGEQFPKSVQERRRQLLPTYKQARSDGKRASLVRDRLFIEGIPYHPGDGHNPRHTQGSPRITQQAQKDDRRPNSQR